MDTTILTPEIKKANDPGFTNFGSGTVITLVSQCLRCTKMPTPCTICSEFCPAEAIETTLEGRPRIGEDCLRCGACIGVCPVNALACSSRTIQQITRLVLTATLRVEHLVVCCERSSALLRLESLTDRPEAALKSLRLIDEAKLSDHLIKVPCFAMLTRELWFSILNEIGTLRFKRLSVYLPPGQCAECPVNANGNAEILFGEAIVEAERWTGHSVGIITEAKDLPQRKKANVRKYLVSDLEMDRRGAFAGFLEELKQSWEENARIGDKALDEVQFLRERKKTFERTRLSSELKKPRSADRNPIAAVTRYALMEALGRNDACADNVRLLVSATDEKLCTYCGTCVDVCPVKARSIITAAEAAGAATNTKGPDDTSKANMSSGRAQSSGPNESTAADATGKLVVNEVFCVACSACMQSCPEKACYFTEISGTELQADPPLPEDGPEAVEAESAEGK
jgi:ferredoxin